MDPELQVVSQVSGHVPVSQWDLNGRNSHARKAAVRFRVIRGFHQDPAYTFRLLNRLERLGASCNAHGLQEFVAHMRADLARENQLYAAYASPVVTGTL